MESEETNAGAASSTPGTPTGARTVAVLAEMIFASRVRGVAQASGVTVITAARADRFLEQARSQRPRLLLVDLEVRGEDVAALIRAVKSDDALRDVPLVAFASHMNTDAINAGRSAGADRVLARSAFVQSLPAMLAGI